MSKSEEQDRKEREGMDAIFLIAMIIMIVGAFISSC